MQSDSRVSLACHGLRRMVSRFAAQMALPSSFHPHGGRIPPLLGNRGQNRGQWESGSGIGVSVQILTTALEVADFSNAMQPAVAVFQTLADYIHLNPVRAGFARPKVGDFVKICTLTPIS